jgi:hypothetical protein
LPALHHPDESNARILHHTEREKSLAGQLRVHVAEMVDGCAYRRPRSDEAVSGCSGDDVEVQMEEVLAATIWQKTQSTGQAWQAHRSGRG